MIEEIKREKKELESKISKMLYDFDLKYNFNCIEIKGGLLFKGQDNMGNLGDKDGIEIKITINL